MKSRKFDQSRCDGPGQKTFFSIFSMSGVSDISFLDKIAASLLTERERESEGDCVCEGEIGERERDLREGESRRELKGEGSNTLTRF